MKIFNRAFNSYFDMFVDARNNDHAYYKLVLSDQNQWPSS